MSNGLPTTATTRRGGERRSQLLEISSSTRVPVDCEHFQHDFDFGDLSYGLEETSSSSTTANGSTVRRVKAVRMNVHTLTSMLEESIDIMLLPHWSKVNRIIFQVMGISDEGELDLYPKTSKTVLQSPLTYLEILRQIRSRFGIEIYVGMPLVYASENLINRQHRTIQDLLETNPEQFWSSLVHLVFKHGFDGIELNLEGVEYIFERLYDQLLDFQYRSKLLLIFKNNYGFVQHHGQLLKRVSELVESIIINAYGYFKYVPVSGNFPKMIPKCECSVSDWFDTYQAYREHEISPSKLMMAIETSSVIYFLDSQNFNEVDCISFTPNKVVEQLRQDGEIWEDTRYAYSEYLDREKNGCILECRERGVVISYDNLRMKKLKFQICRNKGLRGCVIGNILEDVSIYHPEHNLINLMAKYI
jgi:hypothetical protein